MHEYKRQVTTPAWFLRSSRARKASSLRIPQSLLNRS